MRIFHSLRLIMRCSFFRNRKSNILTFVWGRKHNRIRKYINAQTISTLYTRVRWRVYRAKRCDTVYTEFKLELHCNRHDIVYTGHVFKFLVSANTFTFSPSSDVSREKENKTIMFKPVSPVWLEEVVFSSPPLLILLYLLLIQPFCFGERI